MSTLLSVVVILVAVGSMVFAGIQARASHNQTKIIAAASQLTFNLEVMSRIHEAQFRIAENVEIREYVWGGSADEAGVPSVIASQGVLDGAAAALAAVKLLPGFATNELAWIAFVEYLLKNCPGLLNEAIAHPQWWPELLPHVQRVARHLRGPI